MCAISVGVEESIFFMCIDLQMLVKCCQLNNMVLATFQYQNSKPFYLFSVACFYSGPNLLTSSCLFFAKLTLESMLPPSISIRKR